MGRSAGASFVLRRMSFARLLPASLLLAVLTSTIVTTALAGFGSRALPAAVHQRLATVAGASIVISGQIGAARAGTDTSVIRSSVRSALGAVGFKLATGRWSDQLALPTAHGGSQAPLLQAAVLGGAAGHTVLTAGRWPGPAGPGRPIPVAMPAATAAMLHVSVGQELTLPDSLTGASKRILVTGLFRPRDPAAPYWGLSLLGTSGKLTQGTFVTYGPLLVNADALAPAALGVSDASWLVTVDTARIPAADVGALGKRLGAVVSALQNTQSLGGLAVTTSVPQTLSALASSLVVARSLMLIGSLQLLLLAAAAAALAARLMASQREGETALMSARGVARGQLARVSLAEAALITVAGAAAGMLLGSYLTTVLMSASGLPHASGGVAAVAGRGIAAGDWWPAAVITVLVIALVIWPALRPATPGAARLRRGRQAVLATAALAGLDVAVIGLGVLAFWELRRYSAVPKLSGGSLGVDPVLSAAPALALAGAALLPLRALPAAARLLDRASARGRRLTAALASWQVSRRPVREGGPVLLVVLAVATGTLVLAQHQSWRQSQLDQAAFTAGADARVTLAAPLSLGRGAALAHAHGVLEAMPATAVNNGFNLYAIDATRAAGTVLLRPDLSPLPPAALWRRIVPSRTVGLPLPGRPARLAVTAMLRPPPGARLGAMSVSLSVMDGWGIVYAVPAPNLPADGRYHDLMVGLSAGQTRYPLRLLGMSLSYELPGFPPFPYASAAAQHAATHLKRRRAAGRAMLAIRGLAVSAGASGGFRAPFAAASTLLRWHPGAGSADFANPAVAVDGIQPAVAIWRREGGAAALTFTVGAGHLVQKAGVPPVPVSGQVTLTGGQPRLPIPAIVTRAFLGASGAHLGETVSLPVGNITLPARLVAGIRALPTAGSGGAAVIVDQAWLAEALAGRQQPALPVTGWWLRTRGHTAPRGLPVGASVATSAGLAAGLLGDPLPNVPQISLLVIVAAAGLLAGIGFVVSVVAAVRERRLSDALLAALGMGRGARAGQLCLEQLMLSLPAAAAGALIGAALAHLLVPAVTLTSGAAAPFPPVHVVIPLGWTALLALGIAAVPVLAAAATAAYHPDPAAQLRAGEPV